MRGNELLEVAPTVARGAVGAITWSSICEVAAWGEPAEGQLPERRGSVRNTATGTDLKSSPIEWDASSAV
jgi:hypothetical protein